MLIMLGLAATLATFLGGLFALKFRDKLHLVMGFSAGAVIGVAFFDLLPEAISLAGSKNNISYVTSIVALGFLLYLVTDRAITLHFCPDEKCANPEHRGKLGAGTLSLHSFLDGLAIGLAFQSSPAVGAIVTAAVLAHDFSDGINTTSLVLKNQGSVKSAFRWLAVDAVAPLVGVLATLLFSLSESALGLILAIFCGFFLYIGASDLLPESHHGHPTRWTTVMTILGVIVLYMVIKLAQ
jgi:ZIP family zinc transporter